MAIGTEHDEAGQEALKPRKKQQQLWLETLLLGWPIVMSRYYTEHKFAQVFQPWSFLLEENAVLWETTRFLKGVKKQLT